MSYGFGGTQLIYDIATPYLTTTGNTANPTHPIFNGPYTPAGTSWTATYISHGYITGTGLTTLLTATNGTNTWNVLCEKTWGLGRVLFGGITFHSYWTVTAQALNLRENMIYYISNHASPGCVSGRAPITVTVPVMTTISPTTGASGTCNIMSPNSWVYILDPANKLITGVFDATGGNNLMSTTAYLTIDPTVQIHPYTGEPYLQRHVQITPTSSGIADVKLYFTQAEFLALQAAVPAITSINDLVVTKFDDAGVWANAVYFPTPVVTANDPWPGVHSLKISVTGFSRFYIHARFLGGPLPVNLLSFTGTCQDSKVTLNWSTASEINNDYFTVERTKTGEQWEFIATVEGAGNSNQVRNYEAVDNNPMNGVSYYRLSQTDFNGTVKSFGPAEVSCSSTGSEVSVYPNPFKDELVINYRNMTGPKADVKIMDILGNIVMDRSFDLQPSGSDSFMLNLGDLATGLYYIQFKSGDYSYHTRVVKD
jgi:hypothetical protein